MLARLVIAVAVIALAPIAVAAQPSPCTASLDGHAVDASTHEPMLQGANLLNAHHA